MPSLMIIFVCQGRKLLVAELANEGFFLLMDFDMSLKLLLIIEFEGTSMEIAF